jgi:hypothetical protein
MHENFAVKGHRRSIVFTICHNCFTSLGQANDRALHYLHYEQKNIVNSDSEDKLSETDSSEDKLSETDSSAEGDRK